MRQRYESRTAEFTLQEKQDYGPPASTGEGPPRLQGASIMACGEALGAALQNGLDTADQLDSGAYTRVPSVATIITASPLCSSSSDEAGMWLSICWKSGAPPERPPVTISSRARSTFSSSPGEAAGLQSARPEAELGRVGPEAAPVLRRPPLPGAWRSSCAISGGKWRSCESAVTLTTTDFLDNKS